MQRSLLTLQTDLRVTQTHQTEFSYLRAKLKIIPTYL